MIGLGSFSLRDDHGYHHGRGTRRGGPFTCGIGNSVGGGISTASPTTRVEGLGRAGEADLATLVTSDPGNPAVENDASFQKTQQEQASQCADPVIVPLEGLAKLVGVGNDRAIITITLEIL